ncbi:MAG TPA: cytochrome b/b6 domain-containing protein [Steroidobacteraceae bacterium]|nr:cytochrome b/b6 domain-containing protein [Steroidobacteraceae bacterium]
MSGAATPAQAAGSDRALADGRIAFYRHPLAVRLTHWVNALCLWLLLMSGLQILNAHPALYWGEISTFDQPLLSFGSADGPAFPAWITLPGFQDLAGGRSWHFFFAWLFVLNGLVYLGYALRSGRVRNVLAPDREQLRNIGRSLADHLRLRFPHGDAARGYNVLQKLSYLIVLFGLLPLMLLTGLTMSPAMDARLQWLTALFGGRQSARTVHFFTATALVAFFLIHVLAVLAAGPLNEMRSIVTGWFVIKPEKRS